ncbi:hypothetical protein EVJ58_g1161 [Rhodofomes roseus]|uniref:C2H2-type domain-containing protein n=1 Tax=Rhodofomes roseus TaxID=34475 RepID=A0A4Y9Z4C5_9APHY|nr:hypothetical protein EVJ58_g1161 [Rhodofomes roseus]
MNSAFDHVALPLDESAEVAASMAAMTMNTLDSTFRSDSDQYYMSDSLNESMLHMREALFFRDVVESVVTVPSLEEAVGTDDPSSSAGALPDLGDIFDVDAFYGTSESCSSSSAADSDGLDAELFIMDDTECDSGALGDDPPYAMSLAEDSVLGRAYLAVGAGVVPSCLTGSTSHRSASCDASHSRKHHPYAQTIRKRVSSTSSSSTRVLETWQQQGKPRNIQSTVDESHFDLDDSDDGILLCPVPHCNYVQRTGRKPDLKRHIETHRSGENQQRWVCCGVPVEQAEAFGIDDLSSAYWWRGWRMVGGCLRGFSRRDSLGRHLNRASCPCKGHPDMAFDLTRDTQEALGPSPAPEDEVF